MNNTQSFVDITRFACFMSTLWVALWQSKRYYQTRKVLKYESEKAMTRTKKPIDVALMHPKFSNSVHSEIKKSSLVIARAQCCCKMHEVPAMRHSQPAWTVNTVKVRFTRHLKLRAKVPSLSSACRKFSCKRESSKRILHFHSHNWLPQESSNYDHSIKNNPWFCVWPNPTGNVFTSFARTIALKIFDLS